MIEIDAQGLTAREFEEILCDRCHNAPLTYYCPACDYKVCGDCIRVCPTGTLAAAEKGCRIMVGGTFGRFARYGQELYKITNAERIYPILESCVDLIKKEWSEDHEDHFAFVIGRTGISPIFKHLQDVGKL